MLFQVMTKLPPGRSPTPARGTVDPGGYQMAKPYEGFPPALTKCPLTYNAPSLTANARTTGGLSTLPGETPLPSDDHALPFQRAMLLARMPPALVKRPPA